MKIINQIDEHTFVVSLKDEQRNVGAERIIIAHDYLRIIGNDSIETDMNTFKGSLSGEHAYCANRISVVSEVTMGIKSAQKIFLPYIQKHKYMQPEHLEDRIHTEDDKYWNEKWNKGLEDPRYKKGDKYPAYSYSREIIEYWEDGELMVEFSLEGEKNYSKVTKKFFDQYVKSTLYPFNKKS